MSIQIRLEDERRRHPLMRVPPPNTDALLELSERHPHTTFHIACAYVPELSQLAKADNFVFEISSLERLNTIAGLLEVVPPDRLCFGSHTPFYYTQAALMKLRTAEVEERILAQIAEGPRAWRRSPPPTPATTAPSDTSTSSCPEPRERHAR